MADLDRNKLIVNRGMIAGKFPIIKTESKPNGTGFMYWRGDDGLVHVGFYRTSLRLTEIVASKIAEQQDIADTVPIPIGKKLRITELGFLVMGRKKLKMPHKARNKQNMMEYVPCEKIPAKQYKRLEKLEKSKEEAGIGVPDVTENIGEEIVDYR